jgi:hypothetical protein
MLARMRIGIGALTAIALMVLALWVWGRSAELAGVLATGAAQPAVEIWAVRCGAIAAAAGAQLLLITSVMTAVFSRRATDEILRLGAGLMASAAVLGALTLALIGR